MFSFTYQNLKPHGLIVFLLFVTLFPVYISCQTLRKLNIGVLIPTTHFKELRHEYLQTYWKGLELALSEINPLAKAKGIEFHILKEEFSRLVNNEEEEKVFDFHTAVLNTTINFIQTPVHGLIGPFLRHFTLSLVDLATLYRIPYCNVDASIPALKEKETYPYVFDGSPPLTAFAEAFLQLFQHFGWKKFLLLHSLDPFSYGVASSLMLSSFHRPELEFQSLPYYEKSSNQTEINVAIDKMLASPYRVVIVSSIGPALDALLDTLDKRDVFQSGITFLFLGNVSYFFEQRRTEFEKKRFFGEESPLRGLFSLIGWSTSKKLKSFHKFEKKWIDFFKNHTEAELGVETYVCAVTLMLGLLKYPDFISPNTPFSEFLNVSHWEGPGGPLNYNKHYSLNSHMFLSNWQNAGMLDVAEFSVGDSSIDIRQPMFVGGSRVTPSDSPELKDLTVNSSTWMGLTLIIVSSVVGMVCVISIWVYAAHARHALLKPATPTYTIWMLVGLLFVLASDVSQLYIQWHWGCHLTLLLGLFGMGLVMGPLLAKHFLILQVYEVPFKVIGGGGVGGNGGTSSPSPSNPSATVTSSKKWFRKNVGFLINLNFSWSSSPFFPSKPNMLALVIFFIYILLGGLYILLTPLEGELHPIDSFCQAYLCLPKSHSHEHKEVYFNETTHNPLFYLLALYHVLLILTMLWMSWQSQKVTEKKIKFTRDLGITAYIVALIGSLLFLSWVLDELLYPISFWVRSIGLLLLSILFLTLYVLPPILKLNHHHRRFQVSQREIKPPSLPSTNSLATTLPYPGTCPYVYDGRLMYAPPPRSSRFLRWLSFFQPSCTWVQVQAVPQYKFLYLVDLDVGLKYVRVHKKGLASNSISPTSLPTSSTIFQLETNDQVLHSFWTFDEADTEKWLQILKS